MPLAMVAWSTFQERPPAAETLVTRTLADLTSLQEMGLVQADTTNKWWRLTLDGNRYIAERTQKT